MVAQVSPTAVSATGCWQEGFRTEFLVADFEPDAFEVSVAMPQRFDGSESVQAGVSGKYFFGGKLDQANVRWTLEYLPTTFSQDGFNAWTFGPLEAQDEARLLTLSGESKMGEGGRVVIAPEIPPPGTRPARGLLTVEVTDINQQTVTQKASFERGAHSGVQLGLAWLDSTVRRAGEEMPIQVAALASDGVPIETARPLSIELLKREYRTARIRGAGGAVTFKTDAELKPIATVEGQTVMPLQRDDQWVAPDAASAKVVAPEPGAYVVRATGTDDAGTPVVTEQTVFVAGAGEVAWDYRNAVQVDLVPDKAQYAPGEVARILVKTPIEGRGLVSIERGGRVLRTMEAELRGNAPTIEVPIGKADMPNLTVSLAILRGAQQSPRKHPAPDYRYGLCNLIVDDPAGMLRVDVRPRTMEVEPGQPVEIEVEVKDGLGAACQGAEVTLWAVDDGILAITGYERPAPREIFMDAVPLSIRRGISLMNLLPEDPAELIFHNKGYLIGGGGLEVPGLKVRNDFPGTALWQPALRTDKQGKLLARLTAPDALTRYRLVAVAHHEATGFGSGESAFTIQKPVMLLPSVPPVANVGDEIVARAVVRNETGQPTTLDVSLQLDDTAEHADGGKLKAMTVQVEQGRSAAIDLPVRIVQSGQATWRWQATSGGGVSGSDAVITNLQVSLPGVMLREVYIGELDSKRNDLLQEVNPQVLEGKGTASVTVANTRLASLNTAARSLLTYPYGCAEQTMSALLPWTLASDLRKVIPALEVDEEELAATLENGANRIFKFQTPSGGIAFWPGGNEASLYASGYAAVVLKLAADAGVSLSLRETENLLAYLSKSLRNLDKVRHATGLEELGLAVYALAAHDRAEPAYHEQLFQRREELNADTRALLALAMLKTQSDRKAVRELLNPKKVEASETTWFGGPARGLALRLLAAVADNPEGKESGVLLTELLSFRRNGQWQSTQENAWALLAIGEYAEAKESKRGPVSGIVSAGGYDQSFELTAEKYAHTVDFEFGADSPLDELTVSNPKRGVLFGETRFEVRPPVGDQPRQDRGFAVSRAYFKLSESGEPGPAEDLRVGDRILVQLRVAIDRPAHFVAVDDPLPATVEALNPDFVSRAGDAARFTRDYAADHTEMRHDRVLYFCDFLPAGEHTFTYLARVRAAGKVIVSQTKAEEMYRPERFGLGESNRLDTAAR